VHEQKFGHIAMSKMDLFFPYRRPDHGTFFGNDGTFFRCRFASPDLANQITQFQRHGDCLLPLTSNRTTAATGSAVGWLVGWLEREREKRRKPILLRQKEWWDRLVE